MRPVPLFHSEPEDDSRQANRQYGSKRYGRFIKPGGFAFDNKKDIDIERHRHGAHRQQDVRVNLFPEKGLHEQNPGKRARGGDIKRPDARIRVQ